MQVLSRRGTKAALGVDPELVEGADKDEPIDVVAATVVGCGVVVGGDSGC